MNLLLLLHYTVYLNCIDTFYIEHGAYYGILEIIICVMVHIFQGTYYGTLEIIKLEYVVHFMVNITVHIVMNVMIYDMYHELYVP